MHMSPRDPLRILYSFPHPLGAPGIGTTALNQVRSLAHAGATVSVMCTSVQSPVPEGIQVHQTLRLAGRRVPHRAFLGNADLALAYHDRRVARFLLRSEQRFDVVHTWPQSALRTLHAARQVGCLSSREVPNTHTANAYAEAGKEARIVGIELAKRHSHRPDPRRLAVEDQEYAGADLLLVPSAHVEQTFLDRGIPRSRLRRHQYGFDPDRFHARGRTEMPQRPFTAVFVGSAEPRKGLHYALEAWGRADRPSGAQLLVAGGFVPGYRERVAGGLALPGVRPLGFVEDVPALLRRSDVLLLPSVEEGSALVTYEAQASGCVPLVSRAAGALLPPGSDQLVHEPRDVGVLAEQLQRLMTDTASLAAERERVLEWAPNISWNAAGQRMLEIYTEALSENQQAPRRL
jgi:glycosyltransferase involved in cell wall biosynthesis